MNLISVSQLASLGYLVIFVELSCHVHDRHTGIHIRASCRLSGVYMLDHLRLSSSTISVVASTFSLPSIGFYQ